MRLAALIIRVGWLLQDAGVLVCGLPAAAALKGGGQQFIHESRHRLLPVAGFMIKGADQTPVNAGHVVAVPGHRMVMSSNGEVVAIQSYMTRSDTLLQAHERPGFCCGLCSLRDAPCKAREVEIAGLR